jgi:RNA polymerase sigma-70 factor (ECF subfamily)
MVPRCAGHLLRVNGMDAASFCMTADAFGERTRAVAVPFARVYKEYFGFVWRSARSLGVRAAALDDVVQEVFVVVHRRLPEFEGRSALRTWLSSILLNVVRHHRRSLVRKSPHELDRDEAYDPDELASDARDPYETAVQAEGTRLLQHLLDGLDDEKREVLVLAEIEEFTVPEIAEALDLKVPTAYSRLRLAREQLQQSLARYRARTHWKAP